MRWFLTALIALAVFLGIVYLVLRGLGLKTGAENVPIGETAATGTVVLAFFGNDDLDADFSCNQAFPVKRTVPAQATVGRAAIGELLLGPTLAEASAGYFTSLPPGAALESLNISSGTAYAAFNEGLEQGVGGSCRVASIRAQIAMTLKQFPSVNDVVISINGRTEDILQP